MTEETHAHASVGNGTRSQDGFLQRPARPCVAFFHVTQQKSMVMTTRPRNLLFRLRIKKGDTKVEGDPAPPQSAATLNAGGGRPA